MPRKPKTSQPPSPSRRTPKYEPLYGDAIVVQLRPASSERMISPDSPTRRSLPSAPPASALKCRSPSSAGIGFQLLPPSTGLVEGAVGADGDAAFGVLEPDAQSRGFSSSGAACTCVQVSPASSVIRITASWPTANPRRESTKWTAVSVASVGVFATRQLRPSSSDTTMTPRSPDRDHALVGRRDAQQQHPRSAHRRRREHRQRPRRKGERGGAEDDQEEDQPEDLVHENSGLMADVPAACRIHDLRSTGGAVCCRHARSAAPGGACRRQAQRVPMPRSPAGVKSALSRLIFSYTLGWSLRRPIAR